MEVMRMASIAPLAVPHCAMKETQLQGFTIPKVRLNHSYLFNLKFGHRRSSQLIIQKYILREAFSPSISTRHPKTQLHGKTLGISDLNVTWIKMGR
jgi:hypothetical protein